MSFKKIFEVEWDVMGKAVRVTHVPTGDVAIVDSHPQRWMNLEAAIAVTMRAYSRAKGDEIGVQE